MKRNNNIKVFTILSSLLMFAFVSCGGIDGYVEPTKADIDKITIKSISSAEYGNYDQAEISWLATDNGYVPQVGDVYTFTIKGIPNADITNLKAQLIDNVANPWWQSISAQVSIEGDFSADEEFSTTFSIELTGTSRSYAPNACLLILTADYTESDVTIDVSGFSFSYKSGGKSSSSTTEEDDNGADSSSTEITYVDKNITGSDIITFLGLESDSTVSVNSDGDVVIALPEAAYKTYGISTIYYPNFSKITINAKPETGPNLFIVLNEDWTNYKKNLSSTGEFVNFEYTLKDNIEKVQFGVQDSSWSNIKDNIIIHSITVSVANTGTLSSSSTDDTVETETTFYTGSDLITFLGIDSVSSVNSDGYVEITSDNWLSYSLATAIDYSNVVAINVVAKIEDASGYNGVLKFVNSNSTSWSENLSVEPTSNSFDTFTLNDFSNFTGNIDKIQIAYQETTSGNGNAQAGKVITIKYITVESKKSAGTDYTFTCTVGQYGSNGTIQVDLPSTLSVSEGDVVVINGEFTFETPSTGTIVQFYPQDCIGWKAPDYSWISDYTNGLAGQTKTIKDYEWSLPSESAGDWSKIQFLLGWSGKDSSLNGATCVVNIKDLTITKK